MKTALSSLKMQPSSTMHFQDLKKFLQNNRILRQKNTTFTCTKRSTSDGGINLEKERRKQSSSQTCRALLQRDLENFERWFFLRQEKGDLHSTNTHKIIMKRAPQKHWLQSKYLIKYWNNRVQHIYCISNFHNAAQHGLNGLTLVFSLYHQELLRTDNSRRDSE